MWRDVTSLKQIICSEILEGGESPVADNRSYLHQPIHPRKPSQVSSPVEPAPRARTHSMVHAKLLKQAEQHAHSCLLWADEPGVNNDSTQPWMWLHVRRRRKLLPTMDHPQTLLITGLQTGRMEIRAPFMPVGAVAPLHVSLCLICCSTCSTESLSMVL